MLLYLGEQEFTCLPEYIPPIWFYQANNILKSRSRKSITIGVQSIIILGIILSSFLLFLFCLSNLIYDIKTEEG